MYDSLISAMALVSALFVRSVALCNLRQCFYENAPETREMYVSKYIPLSFRVYVLVCPLQYKQCREH